MIAMYGTARPIVGQSFEGEPIIVVPNQAMSLAEIIRRFTRRETLPVEHNGVYAEGVGDLEKQAHEDVTIRFERAAELRKITDKFAADEKAAELKKIAEEEEARFQLWAKEKGLEKPSVPAPPVSGA